MFPAGPRELSQELSNDILDSSVSPLEEEIFQKEARFPGDDSPSIDNIFI